MFAAILTLSLGFRTMSPGFRTLSLGFRTMSRRFLTLSLRIWALSPGFQPYHRHFKPRQCGPEDLCGELQSTAADSIRLVLQHTTRNTLARRLRPRPYASQYTTRPH